MPHAPPVARTTRSAAISAPPSTRTTRGGTVAELDGHSAGVDAHDAAVTLDHLRQEAVQRAPGSVAAGVVHAPGAVAAFRRRCAALVEAHTHRDRARRPLPGPREPRTSTARGSQSPRPRRSCRRRAARRLSSAPLTAATPPCAHAVADSCRGAGRHHRHGSPVRGVQRAPETGGARADHDGAGAHSPSTGAVAGTVDRRGSDRDHPLDGLSRPEPRCRRGPRSRTRPSRSDVSRFSGVIIFMYLHSALRSTGTNSFVGLALRS